LKEKTRCYRHGDVCGGHERHGGLAARRVGRRPLLRGAGIAAALLATTGTGSLLLAACDGKGRSFQVQGGEQRPVLNPQGFADPRVQFSYALAQQHPQVLDQLFCYCHCDKAPFNHKSLLSCFATTHGAG
jgi:hypothetical protein